MKLNKEKNSEKNNNRELIKIIMKKITFNYTKLQAKVQVNWQNYCNWIIKIKKRIKCFKYKK